ncbi:putative leader peptide [Streptomyces sioyaensis]|uniref:putative leader peptide n=1 Tax=Streptomyces sioyaensis TaxID=67364 RepID=UPI0035AB7D7F
MPERDTPPLTAAWSGTTPANGTVTTGAAGVPPTVLAARGCVRLYSRAHIDLQRVAGALCRS